MAKMLPRLRRADDTAVGDFKNFSLSLNREGNKVIFLPRTVAFFKKGTSKRWMKGPSFQAMEYVTKNSDRLEVDTKASPLYVKWTEGDTQNVIIFSGRYEMTEDEYTFVMDELKLK